MNDKSSKIFGWFGWADTGFLYFTGCLLYLSQNFNVQGLSLLAILSALAVPYPVFSIYYQGFVLKKWCPMCLGVQLILIIEVILLLPQFSNLSFSFRSLSGLILTFLVTVIIYTLFIMFLKEKISNEMHYYKYLGFKKNPDILRTLLLNQSHYEIPVSETSLVFGAKNSPMRITVFLSLNCSPCARAFESIKKILHSGMKVTINILMLTQDSKFLNALFLLVNQNKNEEALKLLNEWYNTDPNTRYKVSEDICIPEVKDYAMEVIDVNYKLFHEYNLTFTPAFFINGYLLPNQYDIEDIKYFNELFGINNEILISRKLS